MKYPKTEYRGRVATPPAPDLHPDDPVAKARRQWQARYDEGDAFTVVVSMLRTYAVMLRDLERILKPVELTLSRFEVLLLLSFTHDQRLPAMRLRDLLLIHGSSATYLIDRLVERGWVSRETDSHDRRVSYVTLTDAGRATVERGVAALTEAGWGPVADLTGDERHRLAGLLAALRGARPIAADGG